MTAALTTDYSTSYRSGVDWRTRAACRSEDPEIWFPVARGGPGDVQALAAKAICARCPVRQRCLDWALESGQDWGIWGGLDEDERRSLRRKRARKRVAS